MNTNNVILFPSNKAQQPTVQQIEQNINEIKQSDVDQICELLSPLIFDQLTAAGIDVVAEEKFIKHSCFFVESLRALISNYYQIEHPFDPLAEHSFQFIENTVIFTPPTFTFTEREQQAEPTDDTSRH